MKNHSSAPASDSTTFVSLFSLRRIKGTLLCQYQSTVTKMFEKSTICMDRWKKLSFLIRFHKFKVNHVLVVAKKPFALTFQHQPKVRFLIWIFARSNFTCIDMTFKCSQLHWCQIGPTPRWLGTAAAASDGVVVAPPPPLRRGIAHDSPSEKPLAHICRNTSGQPPPQAGRAARLGRCSRGASHASRCIPSVRCQRTCIN